MRHAASIALLAVVAWCTSASATDDRTLLNRCKGLVARAGQPQATNGASRLADDTELQRSQQIIREWTLRDCRMSVAEEGRALR